MSDPDLRSSKMCPSVAVEVSWSDRGTVALVVVWTESPLATMTVGPVVVGVRSVQCCASERER